MAQICQIFNSEYNDLYVKMTDNPFDLYALRLTCKDGLARIPNEIKTNPNRFIEYMASGVVDYRMPYIYPNFSQTNVKRKHIIYNVLCRGIIILDRVVIRSNGIIGLDKWVSGYIKYGNVKYMHLVIYAHMTFDELCLVHDVLVQKGLKPDGKLQILASINGPLSPIQSYKLYDMYGTSPIYYDMADLISASQHVHWRKVAELCQKHVRHPVFRRDENYSLMSYKLDLQKITFSDIVKFEKNGIDTIDVYNKCVGNNINKLDNYIYIAISCNNKKIVTQAFSIKERRLSLLMLIVDSDPTDYTYLYKMVNWKKVITSFNHEPLIVLFRKLIGNLPLKIPANTNNLHHIYAGFAHILHVRPGKKPLSIRDMMDAQCVTRFLISQIRDIDSINLSELLFMVHLAYIIRGPEVLNSDKTIGKSFAKISKNRPIIDKIKLALILASTAKINYIRDKEVIKQTYVYWDIYLRIAEQCVATWLC